MRLQVHQYGDLIAAGNRDQKHLQQEIGEYQGRVSLSPAVEEQFKQLTRDYDNAQKNYEDLLGKKSSADLTVKMNTQAQGERMFVLNLASLPDSPSFPIAGFLRAVGWPQDWRWESGWRCGWSCRTTPSARKAMRKPFCNCRSWWRCRGFRVK